MNPAKIPDICPLTVRPMNGAEIAATIFPAASPGAAMLPVVSPEKASDIAPPLSATVGTTAIISTKDMPAHSDLKTKSKTEKIKLTKATIIRKEPLTPLLCISKRLEKSDLSFLNF
ncbi:hypothetical protein [Paracidovorax oryzae]|uniref:hypothetical protein n=1 Tax=Paracidovorax oryzae TaxID=862720 RepID=UPI0012EC238D|nr:hypothetical protein [Paracidovorax oryzae]